tara:strand:+ start:2863 stop:3078 length:216 start_codon:yes stop_codon:yes gene_type:complete
MSVVDTEIENAIADATIISPELSGCSDKDESPADLQKDFRIPNLDLKLMIQERTSHLPVALPRRQDQVDFP